MKKSILIICLVITSAFLNQNVYAAAEKGDMRATLSFPGLYVGNKTINVMMNGAAEWEYFIFNQFSAGIHLGLATDFTSSKGEIDTIFYADPFARYQFNLSSFPNWHPYAQFMVGMALFDGDKIAADIVPGGGFLYQWRHNISFGADLGFHILVHSDDTAVAFHIGPRISIDF